MVRAGAGLVAGAVLALTPAAALMFRFNNPDALLVLLMTAAAYCVQRAIERDRTRWLVLAGVLLGFGFLTKMAQAFLVLPAFGIAYLWAGPARFRRRVWQVVVLGLSVVLGAGWWVAIAQLWPASSRPYFGGSTNNNILELALGYNGLGRLDGTETGSIGFNASSAGGAGRFGGGGGGGGFGGATGIFRLFGSEFGGQVSWLIPAALISLGALLWVSRRRARVPVTAGIAGGSASPVTRMRAFAAIWGGWLLVTGVVFSYMQGIIHPYYMVALGPAIGALVGVGATSLWQARLGIAGRVCAAVAVAVTAWWSFVLLDRTPDWLPWLRWLVLIAGLAAMVALFAVPLLARALGAQGTSAAPGAPGLARVSRMRGLAWLPLAFALVAGLAGPLAYSLDTVNHTYTGAIPSAGPTVTGAFGVPGGGQGGFGGFGRGGFGRAGGTGGTGGPAGSPAGPGRPAAPGTGTGHRHWHRNWQRHGDRRVRRVRQVPRRHRLGVDRHRDRDGHVPWWRRRQVRRCRRRVRRRAVRQHAGEQRPDQAARAGRLEVQVDRRDRGLPGGRADRAGDRRRRRDGDRRLQRHRPDADAGPVPGDGRQGRDPLLRRARFQQLRRRHRLVGDRVLGGGPLHRADRGRHHRLRPDPGEVGKYCGDFGPVSGVNSHPRHSNRRYS